LIIKIVNYIWTYLI